MTDNKLSQDVLDKIKKDDIKMKSEMHFALKTLLWVAALVFVLALGLFVVSFIFFVYRANALDAFFVLGTSGLGPVLKALPWILIIAALAIVAISEILARHFAFVYRRPLVYSILILLIVLVFGGMAIARTELHDKALELAQQKRLPIAGALYDRFGDRLPENVHPGVIAEVGDNSFILTTPDDQTLQVEITDHTRRPPNYQLQTGQRIMVVGELDGDTIKAQGIKPAPDRKFGSGSRGDVRGSFRNLRP